MFKIFHKPPKIQTSRLPISNHVIYYYRNRIIIRTCYNIKYKFNLSIIIRFSN